MEGVPLPAVIHSKFETNLNFKTYHLFLLIISTKKLKYSLSFDRKGKVKLRKVWYGKVSISKFE